MAGRGKRGGGAPALAAGLLLAGCTGSPSLPPPAAQPAPPPAPPAACLLDPGGLGAVTGIGWTPDQSTASDTRCVYDPATPAAGGPATGAAPAAGQPAFLTVEIGPAAADPRTELNRVAAACASGSRAALRPEAAGFVCRFRGGSVFAAVVRAGQLVTVSAAGVPEGTTPARLVLALQQQLDALGG